MRNLTEIRTRITAIDEQISALFRERMQVSVDVAEYKRTAGTSIYDPVREHANIAAASERVPEELASYAAALQIVLMEASRAVQHRHLDLHVPLSQLTQPVGSAADHDGCTEDVHLSFAATVPPAPQSSCIIATCCFVLGINLVKLEQQRGGGSDSELRYLFTIERPDDQRLQMFIDSLSDACSELHCLSTYPEVD